MPAVVWASGVAGPVGRGALLVGVVAAAFGAFAAITAAREASRGESVRTSRLVPRFVGLAFLASLGAIVAMEWAMITRDFSLQYVQDHGSRSTPALYKSRKQNL